ncbi:Uncharacterised protein [Mycobacterium tuberculosis]|nr:Uncharacterised protein [Mycobacterium tuberculosis]
MQRCHLSNEGGIELEPLVVSIDPAIRGWLDDRPQTALGLDADPRVHLREVAEIVDEAYTQVAAGLAADYSVQIKGGSCTCSGAARAGNRRTSKPSMTRCSDAAKHRPSRTAV